jgi:hypothetical protein
MLWSETLNKEIDFVITMRDAGSVWQRTRSQRRPHTKL